MSHKCKFILRIDNAYYLKFQSLETWQNYFYLFTILVSLTSLFDSTLLVDSKVIAKSVVVLGMPSALFVIVFSFSISNASASASCKTLQFLMFLNMDIRFS